MFVVFFFVVVFLQAENGIRYLVRSRGLGDVYKRQCLILATLTHIVRYALFRLAFAPPPGDSPLSLLQRLTRQLILQ